MTTNPWTRADVIEVRPAAADFDEDHEYSTVDWVVAWAGLVVMAVLIAAGVYVGIVTPEWLR